MPEEHSRGQPFVIERTFDAPVDRLWEAITGNEAMKRWDFDIREFRPEVGFEFTFRAENGKVNFHHLCKVVEVIPNKKLAYTWRYEGYGRNSPVSFELFPEGNRTRLRLTHEGLDTFPDRPDFAEENVEQGWAMVIGKNRKEFMER